MSFVGVNFRTLVISNNLGPSARFLANYQFASLDVERHTGDCKYAVFPAATASTGFPPPISLGLDVSIEDLVPDAGSTGQVEPSDRLVGRGHDNIGVLSPADKLDGASMNTLADLETSRGRDCGRRSGSRTSELCKVKDAQLLFHATSRDEIGVVRWVRDSAHNVVMLESVEQLAGVGVPNLAVKV
ncbi:hypothetical protein HG530_001779 [Fusarium avenaceum]|nr:hypothetical protein HG530_001779 [Fusarium avenaceum]